MLLDGKVWFLFPCEILCLVQMLKKAKLVNYRIHMIQRFSRLHVCMPRRDPSNLNITACRTNTAAVGVGVGNLPLPRSKRVNGKVGMLMAYGFSNEPP
jgi:hypothetical protein